MKALPPITLEQLAEVTARIDIGTPREEALRETGVPAEMWELAQHTWASLMAEEGDQKKPSLRTRFAELLAEYRAKALHQREPPEQPEQPEARGPCHESSPSAAPPAAQDRTPGLVPAEQKRTIALSAMPDLVSSPLPPDMLDSDDQPRIKGQVDAEQKRTIAFSVVPEPGDDGLPFQAPPAAPQLTLAQYARVCVEMWKAPARGAEICARYGIPDAQAWAAVNQLWQERINGDPTLQQRWIKLTDRMRTPRPQR